MPLDLVKPIKLEAPQSGGTQLDYGPTEANPRQDALALAGVYLQDTTASTLDRVVGLDRTGQSLRLADASATRLLAELVTSVAGQASSHAGLLDVIHFLEDGPGDAWPSGAVAVDAYLGPLRTSTVWYTDATQAKRIVAWTWTYSGPLVATQKLTLYGADGASILRTVTDTYSYTGPLRSQRVRTWGTT